MQTAACTRNNAIYWRMSPVIMLTSTKVIGNVITPISAVRRTPITSASRPAIGSMMKVKIDRLLT